MIQGLIIYPNRKVELKPFEDFKALQKAVNGYIQALPFTNDAVAYVNEEGRLDNMLPNSLATELCFKYKVGLAPDDYIVGNFILVGTRNEEGEDDGEEHDVPEYLVHDILGK